MVCTNCQVDEDGHQRGKIKPATTRAWTGELRLMKFHKAAG
jgi:hypothetical protein